MNPTVGAKVARLSRRSLCSAVALALSLICILLAVAASTTPMTGMADASATSAAVAAPVVAGGARAAGPTDAVVGEMVREAASPVAGGALPPMSSSCDGVCISGVNVVCAVAAGLAVTALLALLLGSRRNTFLELLERRRPRALPRLHQTPWTVRSTISLCVLRV